MTVTNIAPRVLRNNHLHEAQLVLTNPRDAVRGHSRSPFDIFGMVSY